MVYGPLADKEEIRIKDITLKISKNGAILHYRRKQGEEVKKVDVRSEELYLAPCPPKYLPEEGLFEHVMLSMRSPLAVPPEEEVKLIKWVPIDLVVTVNPIDHSNYIDVFSTMTPKMAVYGEVQEGLLTRYLKLFNNEDLALAKVEIKVKNEWKKLAVVSRIVFDVTFFSLCFKAGTWIALGPTINMKILGPKEALVEVLAPRCPEDYQRLLMMSEAKPFTSQSFKYYMRYGYGLETLRLWG
jgi:hypothetical protein